ncbi:hypothetical protein OG241_22420 [Streptomyces sp. NBC_01390]|uniref:hypothetical protein n=1 Tax=Streptomyces sp. NBC_01390 TaxID=2903850 RepID=UPI00324A8D43
MTAEELFPEVSPTPSGALCCHCGRWSVAAVACRHIERVSGPGVTLYACPECLPVVGVGPTGNDVIHGIPSLRKRTA